MEARWAMHLDAETCWIQLTHWHKGWGCELFSFGSDWWGNFLCQCYISYKKVFTDRSPFFTIAVVKRIVQTVSWHWTGWWIKDLLPRMAFFHLGKGLPNEIMDRSGACRLWVPWCADRQNGLGCRLNNCPKAWATSCLWRAGTGQIQRRRIGSLTMTLWAKQRF